MPPSLAIMTAKFTAVFTAIKNKLDGKLDATGVAVAAKRLEVPFELALTGAVSGTVSIDGDNDVSMETSLAAGHKTTVVVEESFTLAAGAVKEYTPQLGGRDIKTARVVLRVKDVTVGSPLLGGWINAEGVAIYGIVEPGTIKVVNQSTLNLEFWIGITFDPR